MSWTFAVLLVLVLLVFFWSAYHWYTTGELPDAWAYRLYQSAKQKPVPAETPLELFAQTRGYELDAVADTALTRALREEQAFVTSEPRWQDSTASEAIVNSWILANLYQYHVQPNSPQRAPQAAQLAADYYERTLDRIRRYPAAAIRAPVAPERILERAIGPVDPAEQAALFEQIRLQRLRDQPDYYAPRVIAADPQNVHDTEVQNASARTFDRLRRLNTLTYGEDRALPTLSAIAQGLQEGARSEEEAKKMVAARFTLARMDNNHPISALSGETQVTERQVLGEAWLRVNDPANEQQRPELRAALVDALADGAILDEHGSPTGTVCASGRCNRVLAAFTLLDADPLAAAPAKTVEILRNEILSKSHQLLETRLRERSLFEEYERGGESPDIQAALGEVREEVRALAADYPDAKPETLQKILGDALAGVA